MAVSFITNLIPQPVPRAGEHYAILASYFQTATCTMDNTGGLAQTVLVLPAAAHRNRICLLAWLSANKSIITNSAYVYFVINGLTKSSAPQEMGVFWPGGTIAGGLSVSQYYNSISPLGGRLLLVQDDADLELMIESPNEASGSLILQAQVYVLDPAKAVALRVGRW